MHTYNDILLNHLIKHISKGRILDLAGELVIIQILSKNIMIIQLILYGYFKANVKQCQNSSINKVCKGMLEF